MIDFYKVLV